ncbi:GIN domain-containing protein [Algibacter sp. PT7-4]|uniref:GIN domain-containing protein n=1 Tax=Algibacter ulvanivorans TaxID=3400999 RepID=UPI003AAF74A4
MNKFLTLLFISTFSFSVCNAQNTEKIKGNRNVTIQQTNIETFHTIALDEDFEIEVIYDKNPYVQIETDENLHEFLEFQVIDSVLTFNKTIKITSKKKLKIKVTYNDALKHIVTTDDAEILSLSTIELNDGSLKTRGSSKAGLTIKSNNFNVDTDDKSKVKLNLTTENCSLTMSGYSKLEALINSSQLAATLYQRADANIEGSSKAAKIELDNNTEFNGKNFTINTCNVVCNISSDAHLEVLENITIDASGSSSIYLYQNPKIVINTFSDTAKLQKKVK